MPAPQVRGPGFASPGAGLEFGAWSVGSHIHRYRGRAAALSPDPYRHSVTAIVVAHDGSRWLPGTIEGLRAQTRPPDHIVAVDNDSRDRSASILQEEFGGDRVLRLPRDTGFGAAVAQALRRSAPSGSSLRALEAAGAGGSEWVWLLHDDCAPAPDALERLLEAADDNRYAAVLGPKLRDWLDRRVLLEAGVTIDGGGRRETGLEQREFDQGQYDGVHEVLAVSSAGALVRRDVWDSLGGFAPELPLCRDDVDFGWRVNASGHRVLAVTGAVAYHAEAATRHRRRINAVKEHPRRLDRRSALFVLFANLPGKLAAWALVRNFFGGLLRALLFMLAKQPSNAWDEARAYGSVVGRPGLLLRVRRRRRGGPKRSYHTLQKLMPPRWQGFRRLGDLMRGFLTSRGPVEAGRHHAVGSAAADGLITEDEEPLPEDAGLIRRLLRRPGVLLFLALVVVAVVAERAVVHGERLGGGALPPVSGGASDLWAEYLSGWHAVGLGSGVPAPPYVGVVALLATVLLGKTWLAIDVLLLGCVPLAGASAYFASRKLTGDVRVRLWAAASYALLPVATGSVASGRFGAAVAFIVLPLVGLQADRMLRLGRPKSTRAAWAAGGLLAVATAFVPLAWPLAVALLAVARRAYAKRRPGLNIRLLIVALVPLVLLLPWTPRLFLHPGLFLREAGVPFHQPGSAGGPVSLLLSQPGGPGTPPAWAAAGLVVAALVALFLRERRRAVAAGWMLAFTGIVGGVVVQRVAVAPPGEASPAPGWPGICTALAGAGIVLAGAVGAERFVRGRVSDTADAGPAATSQGDESLEASGQPHDPPDNEQEPARETRRGSRRRRRRRPARSRSSPGADRFGVLRRRGGRLGGYGLAGVACTAPLIAAGTWLYTGVSGPLDRHNPAVMPAFVAAQNARPSHPRALVVRGVGKGQVSYTVLRDGRLLLGSAKTPAPPGVTDHVTGVVAGLVSGRRTGEVAELARHGVGFVVMPGQLDEDLVRKFDANPLLDRVSKLPTLAVWQLDAPAAHLRIVSDGGVRSLPSGELGAKTRVSPGGSGRTLVLAESAAPGWHATLDGEELTPRTVHGWAQGFALPASGGQLRVTYSSSRGAWVALQGFLVFVVFILALPGGGAPVEAEGEARPASRRERRRDRQAPRRARGHRAGSAGRAGRTERGEGTDRADGSDRTGERTVNEA